MTRGISDRATFAALRRGQRASQGPIWIRHVDDGSDTTRVAYAIGRHYGSAVSRNRARRRLSAVFDALERDGSLPDGAYLVGLRGSLDEHTFAQVTHDVLGCVGVLSK